MESIQVTPGNLKKAAGEVETLANNYRKQYGELFGLVETFTTTDFQGVDAKEFCSKVKDFEDDFMKMKNLMDDYAQFLRRAAEDYEKNQENTRNLIAGLQS
ncbi:MAG: WXG100 family type VII secretion target [Roseburia sp.]|nr:WXG100 family type VII secretion target [Roseburia sp.]MCM1096836.1 WXG100 family type VII secretion target [Ruminococcus flavefaciens]